MEAVEKQGKGQQTASESLEKKLEATSSAVQSFGEDLGNVRAEMEALKKELKDKGRTGPATQQPEPGTRGNRERDEVEEILLVPDVPLTRETALKIKEKTREFVQKEELDNRARFGRIPPKERRKLHLQNDMRNEVSEEIWSRITLDQHEQQEAIRRARKTLHETEPMEEEDEQYRTRTIPRRPTPAPLYLTLNGRPYQAVKKMLMEDLKVPPRAILAMCWTGRTELELVMDTDHRQQLESILTLAGIHNDRRPMGEEVTTTRLVRINKMIRETRNVAAKKWYVEELV